MKKRYIVLIFALSFILLYFSSIKYLNNYLKNGTIRISSLNKRVVVKRDKKGTPYIYGNSLKDLIIAQGYSTAQDRLFQMHMTKLYASGRISEVIGEKGLKSDIKMRTFGFARNAEKHLKILDKKTLKLLEYYKKGINRFITDRKTEHHLEFKLAGIKPEKWSEKDTLTILYFMGWGSAANIKTELITSKIIEKLRGISINEFLSSVDSSNQDYLQNDFSIIDKITPLFKDDYRGIGSNCWITGSTKSKGGKPILSNDPHLDARILPGIWYPTVLVSDRIRAAGATLPGVPGLIIGRNKWIACGITNSYGDTQDLYIEKIDPLNSRNYIEGNKSVPFRVVKERIKIKENGETRFEDINIRYTKRGPVVSDIIDSFNNELVTIRWAPFETMSPRLGLDYLLEACSFSDARNILKDVSVINLNVLIADKNGNIGFQTTGKVPVRKKGEGSVPERVKDTNDNWKGWIPFEEMPHEINSKRDWIANANHKTVTASYPYYYSSYFSPYYRYQRITELLSVPGRFNPDDHYKFQYDNHNVMARKLTPVFTSALLLNKDTYDLGILLNEWDFEDNKDSTGALIFHELYKNLSLQIFMDEFGPEDAKKMLNVWYFWQEKLGRMINGGKSIWFDNIHTQKKENLEMLIQKAGIETQKNLTAKLGGNIKNWKWGKLHRVNFVNPLFRKGALKNIFGTGDINYSGSVDTLHRGYHSFDKSYEAIITASMRIICDLSDDDKIICVLAGGVTGRIFSEHLKDQIKPFINGRKNFIYFNDALIEKNTVDKLILIP